MHPHRRLRRLRGPRRHALSFVSDHQSNRRLMTSRGKFGGGGGGGGSSSLVRRRGDVHGAATLLDRSTSWPISRLDTYRNFKKRSATSAPLPTPLVVCRVTTKTAPSCRADSPGLTKLLTCGGVIGARWESTHVRRDSRATAPDCRHPDRAAGLARHVPRGHLNLI